MQIKKSYLKWFLVLSLLAVILIILTPVTTPINEGSCGNRPLDLFFGLIYFVPLVLFSYHVLGKNYNNGKYYKIFLIEGVVIAVISIIVAVFSNPYFGPVGCPG